MTREQRLLEIRKALAADGRLSALLVEAAEDYALTALRKQYTTNEPGMLIRQAGLAEGAEQFIKLITKAPTSAQS